MTEQANHQSRLKFIRSNGPVDIAIDDLIRAVGNVRCPDLVREMIIAALKAGQEDGLPTGLKLMNTTLKEMRFTAKIFGPYRQIRKVTVFGSARASQKSLEYLMAQALGQKLADAGYMVITGGGPGIMQAVNEGAGPAQSFGVNIQLPFEQKPNPVLAGNPRLVSYKYFFNRKVAFIKEAHAVVLFPGGFGTLDEAMEVLTLVQTGKREPLPLVLIAPPESGYWDRWQRFLTAELGSRGYIRESDLDLFEQVDSAAGALEHIEGFYRRYHSLSYRDEQTLIRMASPIDEPALKQLAEEFSFLLNPGGGLRAATLPLEDPNGADPHSMDCLILDFNRRDFAGLRKLIDRLNAI